MDRLEKYIKDNLEALDRIEPVDADALWQRIREPKATIKRVPSSAWNLQVGRNWKIVGAAASVCLMVGLATWLFVQPGPVPAGTSLDVASYYPEIADEQRAFQQTIAQKEAELKIDHLNRHQYIDIFRELDELEQIHRQQMEDLPQVFDNEEWVRTLMRYYEQKLRILERLSREIDKQEQSEGRDQARSI